MVCLGNICRSPLAECILKAKINPDAVLVDSAGTAGYHIGNAPDSRSIAVAKKYGLDISSQKCRKLQVSDLDDFDFIFAMDKDNYNNIINLADNEKNIQKVRLLLEETDFQNSEVPDPYYGGEDGFEKVYHMIDAACEIIAQKLTQN